MGFKFASFGAATVPLSKIVVDKELDMGDYPIIAKIVKAPYKPQTWETEEVPWGDGTPSAPVTTSNRYTNGSPSYNILTHSGASRFYDITTSVDKSGEYVNNPVLKVNGVAIASRAGQFAAASGEWTVQNIMLKNGDVLSMSVASVSAYGCDITHITTNTGVVGIPHTISLTGKWLALGIDLKGLDATVKIQGVEIPYSDYAKYFPLAPTEITISGTWTHGQTRPIIEAYK